MFEIPLIPAFDLIIFKIESYRTFAYSAFLVGIVIALFEAYRRKISIKHTLYTMIMVILGVLAGSRFFYFFGPWSWHKDWSIAKRFSLFLNFGGTGLVLYGGLIGACIAVWIYCKLRKINVLQYLDIYSLSFPIGLAIYRFGCFLSGSCWGIATLVPWAVIRKAEQGPIHPTQIYAIIAGLVIFAIVLKLRKNIKFEGYLFYWTLAIYSAFRMLIESFRFYRWRLFDIFTASQIISIIIFVFAVYMLVRNYNKIYKSHHKPLKYGRRN